MLLVQNSFGISGLHIFVSGQKHLFFPLTISRLCRS